MREAANPPQAPAAYMNTFWSIKKCLVQNKDNSDTLVDMLKPYFQNKQNLGITTAGEQPRAWIHVKVSL